MRYVICICIQRYDILFADSSSAKQSVRSSMISASVQKYKVCKIFNDICQCPFNQCDGNCLAKQAPHDGNDSFGNVILLDRKNLRICLNMMLFFQLAAICCLSCGNDMPFNRPTCQHQQRCSYPQRRPFIHQLEQTLRQTTYVCHHYVCYAI